MRRKAAPRPCRYPWYPTRPEQVVGQITFEDERSKHSHIMQVAERVDVQDVREAGGQ